MEFIKFFFASLLFLQINYAKPDSLLAQTDIVTSDRATIVWELPLDGAEAFEASISPLDEGESTLSPQYINESYVTFGNLVPGKEYTATIKLLSSEKTLQDSVTFTTVPLSPQNIRISKFVNPILNEYRNSKNQTLMYPVYGAVVFWEQSNQGYHDGFELTVDPPHGKIRLPVTADPSSSGLQTRRIVWDILPGINYQFTVRSISNGVLSGPVIGYERMPPEIPTDIKVDELTTNSVELSWEREHRGILDGFKLDVLPLDGDIELLHEDPTEKRRRINNLTPGTEYKISVFSTSFGLLSFKPSVVQITTPPASPTGFQIVDSTPSSVHISWEKPVGNVEYYEIVFFPTNRDFGRLRYRSRDTKVNLTNLETGTEYTFLVYAVANDLYSESSENNAATKPEALTGEIECEVTVDTLTLGWPRMENGENVLVKYKDEKDPGPFTVITVPDESNDVILTQLNPITNYVIILTVENNGVESSSIQGSCKTLSAPSDSLPNKNDAEEYSEDTTVIVETTAQSTTEESTTAEPTTTTSATTSLATEPTSVVASTPKTKSTTQATTSTSTTTTTEAAAATTTTTEAATAETVTTTPTVVKTETTSSTTEATETKQLSTPISAAVSTSTVVADKITAAETTPVQTTSAPEAQKEVGFESTVEQFTSSTATTSQNTGDQYSTTSGSTETELSRSTTTVINTPRKSSTTTAQPSTQSSKEITDENTTLSATTSEPTTQQSNPTTTETPTTSSSTSTSTSTASVSTSSITGEQQNTTVSTQSTESITDTKTTLKSTEPSATTANTESQSTFTTKASTESTLSTTTSGASATTTSKTTLTTGSSSTTTGSEPPTTTTQPATTSIPTNPSGSFTESTSNSASQESTSTSTSEPSQQSSTSTSGGLPASVSATSLPVKSSQTDKSSTSSAAKSITERSEVTASSALPVSFTGRTESATITATTGATTTSTATTTAATTTTTTPTTTATTTSSTTTVETKARSLQGPAQLKETVPEHPTGLPDDKSVNIKDGFETICKPDNITVFVSKEVIAKYEKQHGPLQFNEDTGDNCRGVEHESYYRYTIGPNILSCGTLIEVNETHVNFSNTVSNRNTREDWLDDILDASGTVYIGRKMRKPQPLFVHMKIYCTFPLDLSVTTYFPFLPQITQQVITLDVAGYGEFSALMQLYEDDTYRVPHIGPPTLQDHESLFVGISLQETKDDSIFVVVKRCWATPTRVYDNESNYPLIDNYCPTKGSLNNKLEILENGLSKRARWMGPVFKFVDYEAVWLHCEVKVCFGQNCERKCNKNGRHRRAVPDDSDFTTTAIVTTGPIYQSPGSLLSGNDTEVTTETTEPTPGNGKLSGTIILVIVVVLCVLTFGSCLIIIILTAKSRRRNRHGDKEIDTVVNSVVSPVVGGSSLPLSTITTGSSAPAVMTRYCAKDFKWEADSCYFETASPVKSGGANSEIPWIPRYTDCDADVFTERSSSPRTSTFTSQNSTPMSHRHTNNNNHIHLPPTLPEVDYMDSISDLNSTNTVEVNSV